jgi:DNA polymerase III delta subunit
MTLVKYLNEQGKSFKEICSILRIPPFTLPSILDSSKGYEWKNVQQIYRKLANLDQQIKTGKIDGNLGLTLICPYL